jgi:chaperonin GroES
MQMADNKKIRPLGDRIIVEKIESEDRTASGLYIPDNAKEKPQTATVLSVGPGKTLDNGSVKKPDVKEGDIVIFGKYSGHDVKIEGKEVLILSESDIYGVVC